MNYRQLAFIAILVASSTSFSPLFSGGDDWNLLRGQNSFPLNLQDLQLPLGLEEELPLDLENNDDTTAPERAQYDVPLILSEALAIGGVR